MALSFLSFSICTYLFCFFVMDQARYFKKELLSKLENGVCEDYELPPALMEELLPRLTTGMNISTLISKFCLRF